MDACSWILMKSYTTVGVYNSSVIYLPRHISFCVTYTKNECTPISKDFIQMVVGTEILKGGRGQENAVLYPQLGPSTFSSVLVTVIKYPLPLQKKAI